METPKFAPPVHAAIANADALLGKLDLKMWGTLSSVTPAPEKEAPAEKLALVLSDLKRVAAEVGVEVRERPLVPSTGPAGATRGGICRLNDRLVLFVDPTVPLVDQIGCVAHGLSRLDLRSVQLTPILQATLGAHRASPVPKVLRNPRPLARTKGRRRKPGPPPKRDS